MCVYANMEVPVLKRQVAEKIEFRKIREIPLLRQYDIPSEIEAISSPKPEELEPEELEPEDYNEKTMDGMNHVYFNGHCYPLGYEDFCTKE